MIPLFFLLENRLHERYWIDYNNRKENFEQDREVSVMCVVSINIPEAILLDLQEDKTGFAEYMKKMLALDLYKNKKVSLGYCASVAEMTKEEFIQYLSMNGVSVFSFASDDEFLEELKNAKGGSKHNSTDRIKPC